jgi:hypothetical protein
MLFSNTLVSFIAAIAMASSVTASVTPVRRGGGDDGNGKPTQSCTTGSLHCCDSASNFEDQPTLIQEGLLSALSPGVLANTPIGLNCLASGVAGWYCTLRLVLDSITNTTPQQKHGILL